MSYTFGSVPALSIAGMITSGIVALIVPILLLVVWKKKTQSKLSSCFIGCGTFVVFALVIESIFHVIFLQHLFPSIMDNIWVFSLYGGFMAGLFEETGRFISMKFLMKKNLNKENAIMYGIGHGGIEAILLCSFSEVSNVATSYAINAGGIDKIFRSIASSETRDQLFAQIEPLWALSSDAFFAAGIERMSAIAFHIGASYLVYKAVKDKKIANYFLAILLHMILDVASMFLSKKDVNVWIIELIVMAFSAAVIVFVIRDYKNRKEEASVVSLTEPEPEV